MKTEELKEKVQTTFNEWFKFRRNRDINYQSRVEPLKPGELTSDITLYCIDGFKISELKTSICKIEEAKLIDPTTGLVTFKHYQRYSYEDEYSTTHSGYEFAKIEQQYYIVKEGALLVLTNKINASIKYHKDAIKELIIELKKYK